MFVCHLSNNSAVVGVMCVCMCIYIYIYIYMVIGRTAWNMG